MTARREASRDDVAPSGASTRASTPEAVSPWWTLVAVECGNFAVYMDGFIVTLVLPAMAREFGVGIRSVKWVVVAYLGALTVSLLLAGRLADPNDTAVLAGVPPEELGVANGFFTTARNFGQAIGASLAAEILAQGLGSPEAFRTLAASIGTKAADAFFGPYLIGQSNAFEVAATLGFLGAIISAQRGPDARPEGR